ncbi:lysophospholipid acyltransferase family protein [Rhodobaculum claviforme]|uniref:1-acyl-sn-glycerol-3-phosphate acyltransferase n=1 Tax=Rhodobaculum claviforme TaxID=1549854 RepID=A0A934TLX3_9RHOB|nr:lysophospholipid acyltransferase family protein [Rhodobaculum claviforme]MBK5927567.1 1-acyl-sn-glycerol-3-phosphate acyltransferase [Rhodobaculum claviforme]
MVVVQYLRSVVFIGLMYLSMAALAVVFAPLAVADRKFAHAGIRAWTRLVRWLAHRVVGLASEVRGPVPTGEVLVAAKHQSFFDIIILLSVLPNPRFVMKKELERAPILGWYARRIGCVSVDRGQKGRAIRAMVEAVHRERGDPGQLVIYPQGTRVAPGTLAPYKVGTGVLYQELGAPCVPVACNVGVFWARHSLYRRPGRAVVEFLPEIPPGMELRAFMTQLEAEVETASNRLIGRAAFDGPELR